MGVGGVGTESGLPSGTVTFLLTDVVGSTELWQQYPSSMPEALRNHEEILRRTLTEHGGYEFGTAGDSFAVAYKSAAQALGSAATAQRALAAHSWGDVQIDVRMGLHTGQAEERDGRYFGVPVNRAARIEALAGPGQIFVSEATCALGRSHLASDLELRDLGDQLLKSFDEPERLFQLVGEGIPTSPVEVARLSKENLPTPATTFVGRESDIDALAESLMPGELMVITGLGGLGKTRLAIEAARRAGNRFTSGTWWIDLTPITDSSVAGHTAAQLGISPQGSSSATAALVDSMRRQQTLLVFDNCEHVIGEAAALINDLRSQCPGVAILATSREPLDLAGAQNWPIRSLQADTDGLALLVERATAHDVSFDASRWPESDLVRLCERLDGMPLGIEMAAARLRALSPAEIMDRLEDRFRLLRSRDRGIAERHQTLLAALDWSYELLDPDERLLLDRLSTFGGSFDLVSVEQVCADERLDEFDIFDLLTSLLEKSLISKVSDSTASRYRMLETVRDYCASHLDDQATAELRSALITYAVGVAQANEGKWLADDRGQFDDAFATFTAEWDNFRNAISWSTNRGDVDACNAILRALWIFAFETFRTEVGDWARSALHLDPPSLSALGVAAVTSNNRDESIRLLERGLTFVDESSPSHDACLCYGVLHGMNVARGGPQALKYAERAAFHAPAMSTSRLASHRANLAMMMVDEDPETAAGHAEFAHDYLDRSSNPWRAACVPPLALYEAKLGRAEIGHQLCGRGLEMTADSGLAWTEASVLSARARISLRFNVGEPQSDLLEAVRIGRDSRAWYIVWLAMAEAVGWFHHHYPPDLAATVAGYMRQRNIWFRPVPEAPEIGQRDSTDTTTASRHNPGARMGRDELIDFVIHELAN